MRSAKPEWRVFVVDLEQSDVADLVGALARFSGGADSVLETDVRTYRLSTGPLKRDQRTLFYARFEAVIVTRREPRKTVHPTVAPWVHHVVRDRLVGWVLTDVPSARDGHEMALRKALCDAGMAGDDLAVVQGGYTDAAALQALADALDALPDPAPPEHASMLMHVHDMFVIRGRGPVLAGQIRHGAFRVGDEVDLLGGEGSGRCSIRAIEMIRRLHDSASAPDACGVLVERIDPEAYRPATVLVSPGSATTAREVRARVTPLPDAAPRWELPFRCFLRGQPVDAECALRGESLVAIRFAWEVWCEPGERVLLAQDLRWVAVGEVFERVGAGLFRPEGFAIRSRAEGIE